MQINVVQYICISDMFSQRSVYVINTFHMNTFTLIHDLFHNYVVCTAHFFPINVWLIFSAELPQSSCVTVTQRPCNISWLFPSGKSIFLFSFASLMTRAHNYVDLLHIFDSLSKWNFYHFLCCECHRIFM